MADNRVVIRINYDKDQQRKAVIDPKMITVWHTRRILITAAILVLTLIPLFVWLFGKSQGDKNVEQASMEPASGKAEAVIQSNTVSQDNQGSISAKPPKDQEYINEESKPVLRPTAIIFDKRVIRAALTGAPKDNKEPGEAVQSPIRIEANQSVELFYFSEIKNMKDKVLFHHWLKNGQVIYKKQLDIKDNKSKLISSRTLTSKDNGDWQVVLIDRKGKLFSEANFVVNRQ